MASKLKTSSDSSQPDIADFIQRQRANSAKRTLSSPTEYQPSKKANMEVTSEVNVETSVKEKLLHLPPDLKLLYDTLNIE